MQKSKIYKTYNQITSEFDVYIMQLGNNNYQFKLTKKLDGDKPPKVTLADVAVTLNNVVTIVNNVVDTIKTIVQRLDAIEQRLDVVEQRLDALDKRLDAIVAANHLIDPTK